ncbi:DMT family transporter [Brevibacillus fulvus]|uniref:Drug/metabolite transporter (DMT)-like permease n=1 Tax=Brevibacillus fulvus TaxID=1125967 RepID=A0A938XRF7_9BACL|nr:DMT family transporter [Brevibacillus fulvus]MBM7588878.1 drug/metabolite transporter (DMT)-like permease [Brevibacillus fulvus]
MKMLIYVKLLFTSIFIGVSFNLASYAVNYFSAPAAAAWRFGLAAVLLLILLAMKERMNLPALKRNWLIYLILGIIGVFGFNLLLFKGMESTSALNGALIMATNPLLSALLARFISKEVLTFRQILGLFLSLFGVMFVITQGSWQVIRTLTFSAGDLLVLGGNFCWALYGVLQRKWIIKASNSATTAYTMTIGAFCLLLFSAGATNPVAMEEIPVTAWLAVGFMAVFTSVLGYLWWNHGLAVVGVAKTSIFFNIVPLVTMLFSILEGTTITSPQMIGAAAVISGMIISTQSSRKLIQPQLSE